MLITTSWGGQALSDLCDFRHSSEAIHPPTPPPPPHLDTFTHPSDNQCRSIPCAGLRKVSRALRFNHYRLRGVVGGRVKITDELSWADGFAPRRGRRGSAFVRGCGHSTVDKVAREVYGRRRRRRQRHRVSSRARLTSRACVGFPGRTGLTGI